MSKREQELEHFIRDWHWDDDSHRLAQAFGRYIFEFLDNLHEQGSSERTIRKHRDNCWNIGIFECQYGYHDSFVPHQIFSSPEADHEYEFKRKVSTSKYALNSYRSTWRQLYKYTKQRGTIS